MIAEFSSNEVSGSIFFALILSILVTIIATRKGFYTFGFEPEVPFPFIFQYPLYAFLLYFFASAFFPRLFFSVLHIKQMALLQLYSITLIFAVFLIYLKIINKEAVRYIFSRNPIKPIFDGFFKHIKVGAITWIYSYPVVLFLSLVIEFVVSTTWGKTELKQVAVEQLSTLVDKPILFTLLSVVIVTIVPFLEELLFRGFLQNYIRQKWGVFLGIVITSLIFSSFHFAMKQGLGNIELIFSLFLLSCYLGFLYEKQKSLWASIGLHAIFNAISIIGILYQGLTK